MQELLLAQYAQVRGARNALLAYCESIPAADIYKPVAAFNDKTIAGMLVHNAYTYLHWLVNVDAGLPLQPIEVAITNNVKDIAAIFEQVDSAVNDFLSRYRGDYQMDLIKDLPGKGWKLNTTPLQLFTHIITHEFHHKGQILSMGRLLGYIPPDTDVIRY